MPQCHACMHARIAASKRAARSIIMAATQQHMAMAPAALLAEPVQVRNACRCIVRLRAA